MAEESGDGPHARNVTVESSNEDPDSVDLRLALLDIHQRPAPGKEDLAATRDKIYTTLQEWETRVLRISPGTGAIPLRTTLYTGIITQAEGLGLPALRRQVTYEALSYCWGENDLTHVINVNGHPYWITANLYEALVGLRKPDEERFLWVDAVCINQANFEEKAAEVQKIFTIFARADRVLVWLGKEHSTTHAFVEALFFENATNDSKGHDEDYKYRRRSSSDDYPYRRRDPEPNILESFPGNWNVARQFELFNGLIDFLNRQWFRRLWVVQEISASKNALVHIGLKTFEWKYIQIAIDYASAIFGLSEASATGFGALHDLAVQYDYRAVTSPVFQLYETFRDHPVNEGRSRSRMSRKREEIYDLLVKSVHRSATDERDRIYALQALARWPGSSDNEGPLNYTPDYTISTAELYETFACDYMNSRGNLGLLYPMDAFSIGIHRKPHCERPLHQDEIACALPSWCPDWRCFDDQRGYIGEFFPEEDFYGEYSGRSRSRNIPTRTSDAESNWSELSSSPLMVKGARLGKIVSAGVEQNSDSEPDAAGTFILEYDCKTGNSFAEWMATAIDEAWRGEMDDRNWHKADVRGFIKSLLNDFLGTTRKGHTYHAQVQRPILILPSPRLTGTDTESQSEATLAAQAIKRGARRGDTWYLPDGTAHGDIWMSPHSADFPLVLRRHKEQDGTFELVGYSEPVFHSEIVSSSSEAPQGSYDYEPNLHSVLVRSFRRELHRLTKRAPSAANLPGRDRSRSRERPEFVREDYGRARAARSPDAKAVWEPLQKDEVFEIY